MLILPIPDKHRFLGDEKTIFPTTKGWLVTLNQEYHPYVFEVDQKVIRKYVYSYIENFWESSCDIICKVRMGLDEHGNIAVYNKHVPKIKNTVELTTLKDFSNYKAKRFIKIHHSIEHDAVFITKQDQTKVIAIPEEILLANESRDNNRVLLIAKQNFYILDI